MDLLHYCSKLDSNLLSLGILEKSKQKVFSVINNHEHTILQTKLKGTIYSLL